MEFLDSDKEIEDRTGADIGWIFDVEGETGFRKREAAMIDELTARSGVLVATGRRRAPWENRKRLVSRGTVIYLNAPLEQQIERTSRDRTRPLLRNGEPGDVLAALQKIGARSIRRSPTSPLRRIVAQRRPWLGNRTGA